jgi:hypothetical protein
MPPGDNLPLDLGEPDFDLVQPGRKGGCKMNADVGTGQEVFDELGFMGRLRKADCGSAR